MHGIAACYSVINDKRFLLCTRILKCKCPFWWAQRVAPFCREEISLCVCLWGRVWGARHVYVCKESMFILLCPGAKHIMPLWMCVCVREVSYTQGKALQDLHYDDMELCVTTTSSWRGTALQKTQSAEIISHQTAHIPHYQNLHQFVLCNIWKSTVGLL